MTRYDGSQNTSTYDSVVTEEPLELRLRAGGDARTLAVTMRTPGNDFELAAGFALSEGIVHEREELAQMSYCIDADVADEQRYNIVNIDLAAPHLPDTSRFERHFAMNSSCGVCGRANLEAIAASGVAAIHDDTTFSLSTIYALPDRMRESQKTFASTGGLHAAALFSSAGGLIALREDIGRHNALDKAIGWALMNGRLPLRSTLLFVSGRASYEILQKAAVAQIPVVAAVSAPSSLAIDVAKEFNITLLGFVRGERANAYSGQARLTR